MDFLRLTKKDHLPTWCDLTESPESEGGDRQRRGAVELWGAAQCSSERQREQQKKQEEGEEGRAGGGWGGNDGTPFWTADAEARSRCPLDGA